MRRYYTGLPRSVNTFYLDLLITLDILKISENNVFPKIPIECLIRFAKNRVIKLS